MKYLMAAAAALFMSAAQSGTFTPWGGGTSATYCPGDQSTSSSSASLTLPAGPTQVMVTPTTDTYIAFGTGTVTAVVGSGVIAKAGVYLVLGIPGNNVSQKMAFISSASGTINVCYGSGE